MGADLYINSVFEPNNKKYTPQFDAAVSKRNSVTKHDSKEAEAAQKRVDKYFDLMYGKGYFRDSYNSTSLLWRLDLSWWSDVGDMLDEEGDLSPAKAHLFLEMLESRSIAPITKKELEEYDGNGKSKKVSQKQVDEWNEYYINKKKKLIAFLKLAIKLNEPIHCSI